MTEARRFSCLFHCVKSTILWPFLHLNCKIGIFYIEMNKRQKKKREKKILLWELERDRQKPKIERYGIDFNYEGYRDPTAAAAIRAMESRNEQSN